MEDEREEKTFIGLPVNWDGRNMFKNLWNEQDDRLFPPKNFGIGWTINFHKFSKMIGLVKQKHPKDENERS